MATTRRAFLGLASLTLSGLGAALLRPLGALGQLSRRGWSVRRAGRKDAGALRDIFNAQAEAELFVRQDLIEPWDLHRAIGFLAVYTGTLILERDGSPVGFVGFIDYAAPDAVSSIAAGVEPRVEVLAVRVNRLSRDERIEAVKRLAVATGRALRATGFETCRAEIAARTGFKDLFTDFMTVTRIRNRDGLPEAMDVSFDLDVGLAAFSSEGF